MAYVGKKPQPFYLGQVDDLNVQGDAAVTGNLTVTGTTITLDSASVQTVDLGDNDKIRLGDADDAQIYHDGTNTIINNDTGNIAITGSNVGINTDSPTAILHVNGGSTDYTSSATGTGLFQVRGGASSQYDAYIGVADDGVVIGHNGASRPLKFDVNETERMRIDSSGNVGIGESNPIVSLQVKDSAATPVQFESTGSSAYIGIKNSGGYAYVGTNSNDITFNTTVSATERMRITSSGMVKSPNAGTFHINGVNPGAVTLPTYSFVADEDTGMWRAQANTLCFSTGGTERMRIDSSGTINQSTGVYNLGYNGSSFAGGERGFSAFAGGTQDYTYIYGRNVVDGSFVYYAIVGNNVKIKFTAEGNGYWDGTGDLGAADYAEYFEWADGNTSEEDRRGYSVILDNGKIRKATADDDASKIIGIISAFPAIVGDSKSLGWQGKWATDEFGARLTRPLEYYEWTDESGEKHEYRGDSIPEDVTIPDDATMTIRHEHYYADDYDPDVEYIPRSERPEWDPVGMLGKLILRKGEPVGDRWIKLEDVSDTLEKWLVR